MLFGFVTSSCFFMVVALRKSNCKQVQGELAAEELFVFTCPEGYYSPLATLIFNTEGGTIRQFFRYPELIGSDVTDKQTSDTIVFTILIYFFLWYIFFITTSGVSVPCGIFLPGMLVGCSLGLMYLEFLLQGMNVSIYRAGGQSYLIIAAAAMLASYTHLTYSLAVVMMETTQSINMFLPILITIVFARGTSQMFNRGLYDYSLRQKQIPLLNEQMPE